MQRLVYLAVFLCLLSVSAAATGYESFSQGISAYNSHNSDQAIALFTSALATGDLSPNQLLIAHLDRGLAYTRTKQCDAAVEDFTTALTLQSDSREALLGRAEANYCRNQFAAAIADMNAVIGLLPTSPEYFYRARIRYFSGDYAGAVSDLKQADTLEPNFFYFDLWMGLAEMHTADFNLSRLKSDIAASQPYGWPAPLFGMLRGETAPDVVLSAAQASGKKWEICEADFYVAEWQLIWQKPDLAKPLLQDAVTNCSQDFVEFDGARRELDRIH